MKTKGKPKPSIYQPLPPGPYIRLLTLEAGHGDQMIFSRLEIVRLDEALDFEAISYVWGSKKARRTIFCNNVHMRLTQNLLAALRRIRHPSKPRVVWADAICINQDDNTEKGHQVASMGRVYSQARRVLIHMTGEDEGHAPQVASLVTDVDLMVRLTLKDIGHKYNDFPWPDQRMKQVVEEDDRWYSLGILSCQPWFRRGWVVQEAGLAQQATILWGPRTEIDWHKYMRCVAWALFRAKFAIGASSVGAFVGHEELYFDRHRGELRAYMPMLFVMDPLTTALQRTRFLHFTDPKDRVFALSDLARNGRPWSDHSDGGKSPFIPLIVEPKYDESAEDVYTDLARQYLQKRGVLILRFTGHTKRTLLESKVPSWVPRWDMKAGRVVSLWSSSMPLLPEPPPDAVTARNSPYLGRFMDEKTLVVRGVLFDTVNDLQLFNCREPRGGAQVDVLWFWRSVLGRKRGKIFNTFDIALNFLTTLTAGYQTGEWAEHWVALDAYCTFLTRWAEGASDLPGDVQPQRPAPALQRAINIKCRDRCLFWTGRGYFGNGPYLAQKGDVLCIIFGCFQPFLLRPMVKGTKLACPQYRLVGEVTLTGTRRVPAASGVGSWFPIFGSQASKDWVRWGLQEQDIYIC